MMTLLDFFRPRPSAAADAPVGHVTPAPAALTLDLDATTEVSARDPALDWLVGRVCYAMHGWGFDRRDVALIVNEALWQCAHAIRQGGEVEIPEVGLFRRQPAPHGARIDYSPNPDLKESNDAD